MKTKLLKKWRREAQCGIGVFKQDDGRYEVLFDKTMWCNIGFAYEEDPDRVHIQTLCKDIEDYDEVVEWCDYYRREFILREARNEWRKRKYGTKKRVY